MTEPVILSTHLDTSHYDAQWKRIQRETANDRIDLKVGLVGLDAARRELSSLSAGIDIAARVGLDRSAFDSGIAAIANTTIDVTARVKIDRSELRNDVFAGVSDRTLMLSVDASETHRTLRGVNAHLTEKENHIDRLNRKQIDIKADVDGGRAFTQLAFIKDQMEQIEKIKIDGSNIQQQGQRLKLTVDEGGLPEKLTKSIEKGFEDASKGSVLGNTFKALTAPLQGLFSLGSNILGGATFGVGQGLSSQLSKGILESVERELGSLFGSTNFLGDRIGSILIKGAKTLASEGSEKIQTAFQQVDQTLVDFFGNPEEIRSKLNKIAKSIQLSTEQINKLPSPLQFIGEAYNDIAENLIANSRNTRALQDFAPDFAEIRQAFIDDGKELIDNARAALRDAIPESDVIVQSAFQRGIQREQQREIVEGARGQILREEQQSLTQLRKQQLNIGRRIKIINDELQANAQKIAEIEESRDFAVKRVQSANVDPEARADVISEIVEETERVARESIQGILEQRDLIQDQINKAEARLVNATDINERVEIQGDISRFSSTLNPIQKTIDDFEKNLKKQTDSIRELETGDTDISREINIATKIVERQAQEALGPLAVFEQMQKQLKEQLKKTQAELAAKRQRIFDLSGIDQSELRSGIPQVTGLGQSIDSLESKAQDLGVDFDSQISGLRMSLTELGSSMEASLIELSTIATDKDILNKADAAKLSTVQVLDQITSLKKNVIEASRELIDKGKQQKLEAEEKLNTSLVEINTDLAPVNQVQSRLEKLNDTLEPVIAIVKPGAMAVGEGMQKLAQTTFKAADALELAAFSMVPGAALIRQPVKAGIRGAAKHVAAPAAIATASLAVPGAGSAIGLAGSGLSQLITPLTGALSTSVNTAITAGFSNVIPHLSGILSHQLLATGLPGSHMAGGAVTMAGDAIANMLQPITEGAIAATTTAVNAVTQAVTQGVGQTAAFLGAGKAIQVGAPKALGAASSSALTIGSQAQSELTPIIKERTAKLITQAKDLVIQAIPEEAQELMMPVVIKAKEYSEIVADKTRNIAVNTFSTGIQSIQDAARSEQGQAAIFAAGQKTREVVDTASMVYEKVSTTANEVTQAIARGDRAEIENLGRMAREKTDSLVNAVEETISDSITAIKLVSAQLPKGKNLADLGISQLEKIEGQLTKKYEALLDGIGKGAVAAVSPDVVRGDIGRVQKVLAAKQAAIAPSNEDFLSTKPAQAERFSSYLTSFDEIQKQQREAGKELGELTRSFRGVTDQVDKAKAALNLLGKARTEKQFFKDQVTQARDAGEISGLQQQQLFGGTAQFGKVEKEAQSHLQRLSSMYGKSGEGIGKLVQEGLAAGLSQDEAVIAAEQLASEVIEISRKKFGIQSPSRVFTSIGNYIDQGLGIGVLKDRFAEKAIAKKIKALTKFDGTELDLRIKLKAVVDKGFGVDGESLSDSLKKAAISPRGQDLIVNSVGAASAAAAGGAGVVPQLGADFSGALVARQALTAGIAGVQSASELLETEMFKSASAIEKLRMIATGTAAKMQEMQAELGTNLFGDITGFGVGNAAAFGAQSLDLAFPGVGAVAASIAVPKAQEIREKFLKAGRDAGKFLDAGLSEGINSEAATMAAKELADDVIDITESTLEIASPSKLFKKFGRWLSQGLGLGIQDDKSAVQSTRKMVDEVIGAAQDRLSQAEQLTLDLEARVDAQTLTRETVDRADDAILRQAQQRLNIEEQVKRELLDQRLIQAQQAFDAKGVNRVLEERKRLNDKNDLNRFLVDRPLSDSLNNDEMDRIKEIREERDRISKGPKIPPVNKAGLKEVKKELGFVEKILGNIKNIAATAFAGFIGFQAFDAIVRQGRAALDVFKQFESVRVGINLASESPEIGAENLEFINKESERLGLNFLNTAESYRSLANAVKGTPLSDSTNEFFVSLTETAAALQLNEQRTGQLFKAFTDSANRGVLSSEEIKNQFSDAGVSVSVFAEALGFGADNIGEFNEALGRGELLATEENLIKIADTLRDRFSGGLTEASKTLQATENRFNNAANAARVEFAETALPAVKRGLEIATGGLEFLAKNMGVFTSVLKIAATTGVAFLGINLLKLNSQFNLVQKGTGLLNKVIGVGLQDSLRRAWKETDIFSQRQNAMVNGAMAKNLAASTTLSQATGVRVAGGMKKAAIATRVFGSRLQIAGRAALGIGAQLVRMVGPALALQTAFTLVAGGIEAFSAKATDLRSSIEGFTESGKEFRKVLADDINLDKLSQVSTADLQSQLERLQTVTSPSELQASLKNTGLSLGFLAEATGKTRKEFIDLVQAGEALADPTIETIGNEVTRALDKINEKRGDFDTSGINSDTIFTEFFSAEELEKAAREQTGLEADLIKRIQREREDLLNAGFRQFLDGGINDVFFGTTKLKFEIDDGVKAAKEGAAEINQEITNIQSQVNSAGGIEFLDAQQLEAIRGRLIEAEGKLVDVSKEAAKIGPSASQELDPAIEKYKNFSSALGVTGDNAIELTQALTTLESLETELDLKFATIEQEKALALADGLTSQFSAQNLFAEKQNKILESRASALREVVRLEQLETQKPGFLARQDADEFTNKLQEKRLSLIRLETQITANATEMRVKASEAVQRELEREMKLLEDISKQSEILAQTSISNSAQKLERGINRDEFALIREFAAADLNRKGQVQFEQQFQRKELDLERQKLKFLEERALKETELISKLEQQARSKEKLAQLELVPTPTFELEEQLETQIRQQKLTILEGEKDISESRRALRNDQLRFEAEHQDALFELSKAQVERQATLLTLGIEKTESAQRMQLQALNEGLEIIKIKNDDLTQSLDRQQTVFESFQDVSKAIGDARETTLTGQLDELRAAENIVNKLQEAGDELTKKQVRALQSELGGFKIPVIRDGDSQSRIEKAFIQQQKIENDLLLKRQSLEDDIARTKFEALQAELKQAQTLLDIDLKRQAIAAKQAVVDSRLQVGQAQIGAVEASAARERASIDLRQAQTTGTQIEVDRAQIAFDQASIQEVLAQNQVNAARFGLQQSEASLADLEGLTQRAIQANQISAASQLEQFMASERSRERDQRIELIDRGLTVGQEARDRGLGDSAISSLSKISDKLLDQSSNAIADLSGRSDLFKALDSFANQLVKGDMVSPQLEAISRVMEMKPTMIEFDTNSISMIGGKLDRIEKAIRDSGNLTINNTVQDGEIDTTVDYSPLDDLGL